MLKLKVLTDNTLIDNILHEPGSVSDRVRRKKILSIHSDVFIRNAHIMGTDLNGMDNGTAQLTTTWDSPPGAVF